MDVNDAEEMRRKIDFDPIATFAVIRLRNQDYAEVEPTFFSKFRSELLDDWKVVSEDGEIHVLKCNFHKSFPLIIDGWDLLRNYYHLPKSVEVVFSYHGDRCFGIKSVKRITCCIEILPFHSRGGNAMESVYFEVPMGPGMVHKPKLRLNESFSDFICGSDLEKLMVLADDGYSYSLDVIKKSGENCKAKFGYHWNLLCEHIGFEDGDVICFKFDKDMRCHMYKIND